MAQVHGKYTAVRDGMHYEFNASWQVQVIGAVWSASVYRNDKLVGTPSGVISDVTDIPADVQPQRVTQAVQGWIERCAG